MDGGMHDIPAHCSPTSDVKGKEDDKQHSENLVRHVEASVLQHLQCYSDLMEIRLQESHRELREALAGPVCLEDLKSIEIMVLEDRVKLEELRSQAEQNRTQIAASAVATNDLRKSLRTLHEAQQAQAVACDTSVGTTHERIDTPAQSNIAVQELQQVAAEIKADLRMEVSKFRHDIDSESPRVAEVKLIASLTAALSSLEARFGASEMRVRELTASGLPRESEDFRAFGKATHSDKDIVAPTGASIGTSVPSLCSEPSSLAQTPANVPELAGLVSSLQRCLQISELHSGGIAKRPVPHLHGFENSPAVDPADVWRGSLQDLVRQVTSALGRRPHARASTHGTLGCQDSIPARAFPNILLKTVDETPRTHRIAATSARTDLDFHAAAQQLNHISPPSSATGTAAAPAMSHVAVARFSKAPASIHSLPSGAPEPDNLSLSQSVSLQAQGLHQQVIRLSSMYSSSAPVLPHSGGTAMMRRFGQGTGVPGIPSCVQTPGTVCSSTPRIRMRSVTTGGSLSPPPAGELVERGRRLTPVSSHSLHPITIMSTSRSVSRTQSRSISRPALRQRCYTPPSCTPPAGDSR